jgi:hypothetical protein
MLRRLGYGKVNTWIDGSSVLVRVDYSLRQNLSLVLSWVGSVRKCESGCKLRFLAWSGAVVRTHGRI